MLITVEEIKLHLREDLEPDAVLDAELEALYAAAVEYCEMYINKPLVTVEQPALPPSLRSAVLLVIGDLYAHREAQSDRSFNDNPAVERLLHFHRVNMGV